MNLSFQLNPVKKKIPSNYRFNLLSIILIFLFISCSSTTRFTNENTYDVSTELYNIRVLINENQDQFELSVDSKIRLVSGNNVLAKIKSGNKLFITLQSPQIQINISDTKFTADSFFLVSDDDDSIIRVNNKKYRGRIKIFSANSQIKIINQIGLEDYVKGVITKEMPVGRGDENYEALKAFSICIRTYALVKIFERKAYYDIYPDTRDQVYGGADAENSYTNSVVDETKGLILSYNDSPAVIFYHAACGGFTEDVKNVFTNNDLPYLKSIKDGNDPFCSIAPKFYWTEEFSEELFLSRLFDAGLINSKDFSIKQIEIKSRFESGRVNELVITLSTPGKIDKKISLYGNKIRGIIKTADGKSILRSTLFDVSIDKNKNVIISGKGYGHGVGFCQWGAIGQSKQGINYKTILNHYFPGIQIEKIYD